MKGSRSDRCITDCHLWFNLINAVLNRKFQLLIFWRNVRIYRTVLARNKGGGEPTLVYLPKGISGLVCAY
jgi:hypothetical protein